MNISFNTIQIFLILLTTGNLIGQNLTFKISDTYVSPFGVNSDLTSFIPLFELESNIVHNKNQSNSIKKFPKTLDKSQTAYGFVTFRGVKNSSFKNEITILVENYMSSKSKIYIDRNGNLNFSDDGDPLIFTKNHNLRLLKKDNPSASLNYKLSRSNVAKQNELRLRERYSNKYSKSKITSVSNWLTLQRLSIRVHKDIINEKPITILLADNSSDGIFSFETGHTGDRILIVEGHVDIYNDLLSTLRQGEPIDHNAVFELYGKKYFLKSASTSGDKIMISETNKNTKVMYKEGMDISSFSFKLIDGTSSTVADLTNKKEFLLLDVGGTWCGGCIKQEPTIKKIYNSGKVAVIGLFDHDTPQSVNRYIQNHSIKWPVALVDATFRDLFRVNSFPTYILVSSNGKFLIADSSAKKIVEFLSNQTKG